MAKKNGGGSKKGGRGPERRPPVLIYVAAGVALVAVLVAVRVASRPKGPELAVETVANQVKYHLDDLSSPHEAYRSDPPVGGPHAKSMAAPGFYDTPVQAELLVHNLEDGHVVIYYRPGLPEDVITALRNLADKYAGEGRSVVVVPRQDTDSAVVLTAWRKILRLKDWDAARGQAFIDRFIGIDHHQG